MDVWNTRFGKLYAFIRNRLLHICNVDVNEIPDIATLEAWHASVSSTHPLASEILGLVLVLKSAAQLDQGTDQHLQLAISTSGREHEQAMTHDAKDKNEEEQQSEQDKVQDEPQRGNSGDEGQIHVMQVEVEDATRTEQRDDKVNNQATEDFLQMMTPSTTAMVHGLDLYPCVEVSDRSGGDDDDSACTPTDADVKRKRVSSTASTLSQVSISIGAHTDIFGLAEYTTAGHSLEKKQM